MPAPLSSFIGRTREIAEAKRLLAANRLLTLTGAGGCGKTRRAIQVAGELARELEIAVVLTEFAPLADAALVPQAVASNAAVHEQRGRSLTDTLAGALLPRRALLVFDNCEHLVSACAQLAETLLRACPQLRILATSREPLGVAGEIMRPSRPPWPGKSSL